jgi:hypothetical protein
MGKGIKRDLEQLALLWIDLLGFSRAHAEGGRIKSPYVVEDTSSKGIATAFLVRGGVVEAVDRKSVSGDTSNRTMTIL